MLCWKTAVNHHWLWCQVQYISCCCLMLKVSLKAATAAGSDRFELEEVNAQRTTLNRDQ